MVDFNKMKINNTYTIIYPDEKIKQKLTAEPDNFRKA